MNMLSPTNIIINRLNLLIGTILIIVKPDLKLEQIKGALAKQEETESHGERKKIGEILIDMQAITAENLEIALRFQKFIKNKLQLKLDMISIETTINCSL